MDNVVSSSLLFTMLPRSSNGTVTAYFAKPLITLHLKKTLKSGAIAGIVAILLFVLVRLWVIDKKRKRSRPEESTTVFRKLFRSLCPRRGLRLHSHGIATSWATRPIAPPHLRGLRSTCTLSIKYDSERANRWTSPTLAQFAVESRSLISPSLK